MLLAWADVTGRCWQTMLGLADAADRMVQRLKEARIDAIEAQSKLVRFLTSPIFRALDAGN
jgi:hypothetical protein